MLRYPEIAKTAKNSVFRGFCLLVINEIGQKTQNMLKNAYFLLEKVWESIWFYFLKIVFWHGLHPRYDKRQPPTALPIVRAVFRMYEIVSW